MVTGEAEPLADAARRVLQAEEIDLVETAALDDVISYRPRDLVVTVGAGTGLARLREILAERGQWLPAAEPGCVDALPGTVGGLVAAAPAGPFEALYGPVRRQLLACRVVARDGTVRRWGRPVMKNVAGYALHSLHAGSRGRLGILVEVSLRTWARPTRAERWSLAPGPKGGSPLGLGASLATEAARGAPIPDALAWRWPAESTDRGRLELRLHGTDASVEARRRALEAWAGERGGRLEARGENRADLPDAGPDRDRSLRRVVLRLSVPPTELHGLAARVTPALPGERRAAEAFPLAGVLRCTWERHPTAGPEGTRAVLEAAGPGAAVTIERGGPAEHAAAAGRESPGLRALETRVVEALGGGPRSWVADYV